MFCLCDQHQTKTPPRFLTITVNNNIKVNQFLAATIVKLVSIKLGNNFQANARKTEDQKIIIYGKSKLNQLPKKIYELRSPPSLTKLGNNLKPTQGHDNPSTSVTKDPKNLTSSDRHM